MRPVCVLFPFEEIESQRPRPSAGGCLDPDACPGRPVSSPPCPVPRPPLGSWARGHWQHVSHPGSRLRGPNRCSPCFGFMGLQSRWESHQRAGKALWKVEMPGAPPAAPTGARPLQRGPRSAQAPTPLRLPPRPALWTLASPPLLSTVCVGGKRSGLFKNSSCFLFIKRTHTRLQFVFPGSTAGLKEGRAAFHT